MTTDTLALARQQLLTPAGLGEADLHRALSCLLGHAIDSGDLYFQHRRAESWGLEDGRSKTPATPFNRASASGRSAARKPALPIPTRS